MGKKELYPLTQASDPLPFRAAVEWCESLGIPIKRTSPYQLKVGPWNFYTKGSFHHDGDPKRRGFGLPAFKAAMEIWLDEQGLSDIVKR